MTVNENDSTIRILLQVKNEGDIEVVLSDDHFKTKCDLAPKKAAVRPLTLKAEFKKNRKDIKSLLSKKPMELQYRLVYYPKTNEKEKDFFALEAKLKVSSESVEIISN